MLVANGCEFDDGCLSSQHISQLAKTMLAENMSGRLVAKLINNILNGVVETGKVTTSVVDSALHELVASQRADGNFV